jgi:DNA modification methylase
MHVRCNRLGGCTLPTSQAEPLRHWLSKRNQPLRDVWDIAANSHENKACRHPPPKPLAVLARILDVAGRPGGLLLDLFSGSDTGAVAASEWGMQSVSIDGRRLTCR